MVSCEIIRLFPISLYRLFYEHILSKTSETLMHYTKYKQKKSFISYLENNHFPKLGHYILINTYC